MADVTPGDDSPPRAFPAWAPVALLTALALWIRLAALPGTWGSDSLTYFDACRAADAVSIDPRANRWLAVALVRASLRLGGWAPAWASVPSALMSAAVVPCLWLALRRRLGDGLALLPCALWTFLGLGLEQCAEISSDVMLVLPAALAVWGLAAAAQDEERRTARLVAAGAALGVGATLKETMLFALVGFAAGAACLGRGRRRVANAAALAAPALVLFGAGVLLVDPARLRNASEYMSWDAPFLPASGEAFLRRVTVEIPESLLTATQAYGLLFVAALPLVARLPFRALRGDPLATATIAGFAAFDALPISLKTWALLPASRPRYLLCLMPLLFAALAGALRGRPSSKAERWACGAAALAALVFVGRTPWATVLVPPAALLCAWTALPDSIALRLSDRTHVALAAAFLVAATAAWPHAASAPSPAGWTVAALAGALVAVPWVADRGRAPPAPHFAAGAALVLAVAAARARFVPDEEWNAWTRLPARGRVFAEHLVARRLVAASVAAGADASRVVAVETDADLPRGLRADDRVLARGAGPVGGGPRLAEFCRLPGSGLAEVPPALGETVLFAPASR
jgi:hypothetical protein